MVEPYWQDADGAVQLYLGDMREVLPALGITCDLIVADPPYEETEHAWDRWPVLVQCRSWAITLPARADVTGVCGGLTEEERARERRRRAQPGAAPDPPPLPGDRLRCTRCGQVKPDGEFAADPRLIGRRGRRSHCRTCVAAWRREHRAARRQA